MTRLLNLVFSAARGVTVAQFYPVLFWSWPRSVSQLCLRGQQANAPVDPNLYSAMRWRLIGPYRAGRVSAVAGIPGNPAVYYMGTPGGGVWKTTDGGRVWKPIFDEERVASIGAVAIAPSNPDIVYVGTGEQTEGNGMYKSTDAGATWTHIGLEDTKYISAVIVDPRDPNIVVVGVLGHPILGTALAAKTRGVYKTTDGGKTWTKTLYKDDLAGISDMVADPNNPRVLYAAMWRPRDFRAPPEPGKEKEQTAWIYKSGDEGATWKQLPGTGFPADPLERVGLAVAPGDRGRRVFVIAAPGLFRSDDAGETWRKITSDPRITGNSYICHVYVDPRNPDVVYVMQTTTYRSTDGGQTFVAYKGAPGGDDYHVLWIDPQNSDRMLLGVDQGGTISVDGGKTWSTWYNQPTGQFYHVITDNQFPYVAYAPQQDSGTVAVPSRSDFGEISYRDWFSIGGFEFCYIAPDPLNPNIVYSGGWYGSVVRFDKVTGQITHVFIRGSKYRAAQMPPLVFSPQDPHTLYLGTQYAMKTQNGGDSWQVISPDLTDRSVEAGAERKPGERVASSRTAITSIAPSTPWIVPRIDFAIDEKWRSRFRRFPLVMRAFRQYIFWRQEFRVLGFLGNRFVRRKATEIATRHMQKQIQDPKLRAALTPKYELGCKRVLVSDDFYPTLKRENVELITEGIAEVCEHSIVTTDGIERPIDVLIFGTGFRATEPLIGIRIVGRGGVEIHDAWRERMSAYLGVTVNGFPNFFLLLGPNTGLGHNSVVLMIEAQVRYVMSCLKLMQRRKRTVLEVRSEIQRQFRHRNPSPPANHRLAIRRLPQLVSRPAHRRKHHALARFSRRLSPPHALCFCWRLRIKLVSSGIATLGIRSVCRSMALAEKPASQFFRKSWESTEPIRTGQLRSSPKQPIQHQAQYEENCDGYGDDL